MIIKKFEQINEGTWALSKGRHKRVEDGKKFIAKIEKLKQEIYPIFGDDSLFDEFDGAVARIEELMELPEDQVRESITPNNDEEIYAFNLRMVDIREIIVLMFANVSILDMDDIEVLKSIELSVRKVPKSHYGPAGEFINVDTGSYVIKIWEDGFVALENGLDVMHKFDNAVKVYEVITKRMK